MRTRHDQSSAKILQFPEIPPVRRDPLLGERAPNGQVASLRNPQIVFGAWYHQAEIEKDAKPRPD